MGRYARDAVVMDAPFDIRINVLECDVEGAAGRDTTHCAFARAVGRVMPGAEVSVGAATARIKRPGTDVEERFVLSPEAQRMIRRFDRTGEFEPGIYEFRAPTATRRLGYHPESARIPRKPNSRAGGRYSTPARRPYRIAAAVGRTD